MEIFRLFNEWPKSPEKNKAKDCAELKKQLEEKDVLIQELQTKIEDLENEINDTKEHDKQMQSQVDQLEHVNMQLQEKLAEQFCEIEALNSDCERYKNEAEVSAGFLTNVEFAFNDVHSKYERSKSIIEELKNNESNLTKCIESHESDVAHLQKQYADFKSYTCKQFEEANIWVNNANQEREIEMSKLKSKIRKLEITTAALDQNLQQKILENEQLSSICDELINKQQTYYVHEHVKDYVKTK